MKRRTIRMLAAAALAGAMIAVIAVTNWRLALLAALAAGAIALTRLRYAAVAALVLLAITLALALIGLTGGTDDRDVSARTSHRH